MHPLRMVAVALLAIALAGCGGPMTSGELGRSVETLRSGAAEGKLLAQDAAADRTKATFVRVRAREIGETADHEAEKLSDAEPSEGLASKLSASAELAGAVSEAVGTLRTAPGDEREAAAASRRLDGLAARARRLEGSL